MIKSTYHKQKIIDSINIKKVKNLKYLEVYAKNYSLP